MEIEEKIILEVEKILQDIEGRKENELIRKVNKLFVYQAVKLTENKEQQLKHAVNYIENKLFDIIK